MECKTGERSLSRNIAYFADRTPIPIFYQVHTGARDEEIANAKVRVLPFAALASLLAI